jgi:acetylglutamate kinase
METLIKRAEILIEALPYIQKLYGKTVVIKYGGSAMINEELKNSVMEDITLLKYVGMNPVLVHGGGPDITRTLEKFNIKSEFVNGLRVTDIETMQVAQMVLVGKTNKEIVSILNQKGGKAIGLCGIDGNLIECEQYKTVVDGRETD